MRVTALHPRGETEAGARTSLGWSAVGHRPWVAWDPHPSVLLLVLMKEREGLGGFVLKKEGVGTSC